MGTTFFFASRRLPREQRLGADAVYAFVRMAPAGLEEARRDLIAAAYGKVPGSPVMRAFADIMRESSMPLDEPFRYLDAIESEPSQFPSYESLRTHLRNEAGAIAAMTLWVFGEGSNAKLARSAQALAIGMKLTSRLRSISPDVESGQIYLPKDEMQRFGVTVDDLEKGRLSKGLVDLLRLQISRARTLYRESDEGIKELPDGLRFGVTLARDIYEKILDKIDENGYDIFRKPIRTTPQEKMVVAWSLWSGNSTSDGA